jgi:hypothetical protein
VTRVKMLENTIHGGEPMAGVFIPTESCFYSFSKGTVKSLLAWNITTDVKTELAGGHTDEINGILQNS